MADNTNLSAAVGDGDDIRTKDRAGTKTPVSLIDVGGTSAEALIGDSGVAMPVRGMAQEDAIAAGNPVPAGGRYDVTPRTLDDGDRGEVALDVAGKMLVVESSAAAIKTAVETIDNAIAGNEMQVDVVTSALPTGAATLAEQQTQTTHQSNAATSLAVMDDWDETDRAKVNLIAGQAGITGGAGVVGASTPRVTLASDDPAVVALQLIDNLVKNEDSAHVHTDAGIQVLAVRQNAAGAIAGAEGDYSPLQVDDDGFLRVIFENTVDVAGNALTALQKIDDPVLVDDAAFTPGTSSVMMAGFQADETATDSVNEGDAGAVRMTLDRKLIATLQPHTKGGAQTFRSIDLDETEEDIKTSAGQLYGYYIANLSSSLRYLKFYNATAASTTVGSTTPKLTFPIPAGVAGHFSFPVAIEFDTAICAAATTGLADADTGAPGNNEVVLNAYYL